MSTGVTYPDRYCPVCRQFVRGQFRPGPNGRPDAGCPHCGSLERQRFLALLLGCLEPGLGPIGTLLDIAPSPQVTGMLAKLEPQAHVRTDLGADPRTVDCYASLTELPFPDDSVDFLICYHVLEHVPDDHTAMRELARVLSPGALGLLQVPWRPDADTDEDPDASEEERIRRFGQADHVRWYGRDFEDRLVAAGLGVRRVTPGAVVGAGLCGLARLNPEEAVWLVSPEESPRLFTGRSGPGSGLAGLLDDVAERLGHERARRDRARARVDRLRDRVRRQEQEIARLRGVGPARLPRRFAGRVRGAVGRLRHPLRRDGGPA